MTGPVDAWPKSEKELGVLKPKRKSVSDNRKKDVPSARWEYSAPKNGTNRVVCPTVGRARSGAGETIANERKGGGKKEVGRKPVLNLSCTHTAFPKKSQ